MSNVLCVCLALLSEGKYNPWHTHHLFPYLSPVFKQSRRVTSEEKCDLASYIILSSVEASAEDDQGGTSSFQCFLKGWHHPGRSFIDWAHVTSFTFKANLQSTNTSHTWIDIVSTNHKKKGRYLQRFRSEKSLLAPSFESATIRPRSSSLCSNNFLTSSL